MDATGLTMVRPSPLRLLVLCALAASVTVSAASYLVAPDGTPQGDGSQAKPYSVAHALTAVKLQPGDEVVFRDGVYSLAGGGLNVTSTGDTKAPITYRAEHRHQAILDGGAPVTGWQKAPNLPGVWQARMETAPGALLVNGDGLVAVNTTWRRDGKQTLDEGMFAVEDLTGEKPDPATELEGTKPLGKFLVAIHPWANQEPKEVFSLVGSLFNLDGSFNVVDGLVFRRAGNGVRVGGRQIQVYKPEGIYLDLGGLGNNASGSYNILRNCIVRDMTQQGLTSNESRFDLIEDCVIYNAGMGQGDHGIYISQGAENLTLRRNVWWRTSGGAIHIYSGTGVDSPRGIVVAYNIFGPDKRNRCFPIKNRKSAAFYIWGGSRWAGNNRIVHNLVIGPYDRAISINKCSFNLIAHNTFLNSDGAPLQVGSGFGNLFVNNIIEYSPGGQDGDSVARPDGYYTFIDPDLAHGLSQFTHNLLLPRGDQGKELPVWEKNSRLATRDPFLDRASFDPRLKPDSEAIDAGLVVPDVSTKLAGQKPDAGALELGEEAFGEKGLFPTIPPWLLAEWPPSKRGQ